MAGGQVEPLSATTFLSSQSRTFYGIVAGMAVLVVVLVVSVAVGVTVTRDRPERATRGDFLSRAKAFLDRVPLVDGHNDFPFAIRQNYDGDLRKANLSESMLSRPEWYQPNKYPSMTDIPRLREGKVGGVFWSVFATCEAQFKDVVKKGLQQIDLIRRFTAKYPEHFEFVTSSDGIKKAHSRDRIASMIGIEGGHFIDNSLDVLRMYYALGARYMTLTWSCNLQWADSYLVTRTNTSEHGGLTPWGKKENGGIIMINLYAGFINCTEETRYINDNRTGSIAQVIDHLNHLREFVGVDHVGIGADFDGMDRPITDLEDVSMYPNLFAALLQDGWTEEELEKLASGNIIRVWGEIEAVRDQLKDTGPDETPFEGDLPPNNCTSSWLP